MKNRKGLGSIYRKKRKRNGKKVEEPTYYISYYVGSKRIRECTYSTDLVEARKLLIKRQREAGSPRFGGDDPSRITFDDLVALIRADYEQKQHRTWDRVDHASSISGRRSSTCPPSASRTTASRATSRPA